MGGESIEIHDSLDVNLRFKWDEFVSGSSPFLQSRYCEALDESLGDSLEYRYVVFKRKGEWIGVAPMQVTDAITTKLESNLPEDHALVKLLVQGLSFGKKKLEFKVLVVGNSFISGEHGYHFHPEIPVEDVARMIHEATLKVEQHQTAEGKSISATIIKDFIGLTKKADSAFGSYGYFDFQVDPNMVMPILPNWNSFDDYLSDLNSKFRTKAKAALRRSSEVQVVDMNVDEIERYSEDIQKLYDEVYSRADFKLGYLTPQTFIQMKAKLADQFMFKGYFFQEKLIAFQTGFVCQNVLEAHMVGIDYSHNQDLAVYQTMLYTYIREGIKKKVGFINFGRTAMEIKSTVGATDQHLHCFIRHRKSIPNKFLGVLFGFVKPTEHELRNPWKKEVLLKFPELETAERFNSRLS